MIADPTFMVSFGASPGNCLENNPFKTAQIVYGLFLKETNADILWVNSEHDGCLHKAILLQAIR